MLIMGKGFFLAVVGIVLGSMWRVRCESVEQGTITICQLFQDLRAYSGKTIRIRGELETGRHIFALGHQGCPVRFSAGGLEWPTVVDLRSKLAESPTAFDVNRSSIERMDKLLCFLDESTASELGVEVEATFIGELRVREQYRPNKSPSGAPYGSGYGHMGGLPAQLVYRAVENIVIRQKSK
jgi:hypothetical protein